MSRGEPVHYEPGVIAARLRELSAAPLDISAAARADADRRKAAVVTAIHPDELQGQLPELLPSPYPEQRDEFPLTLPAGIRKAALRELHSRAAMAAQLALHARTPDSLLQLTLAAAIAGEMPHSADMDFAALQALETVSDWLEGTEPGARLPTVEHLQQSLNRARSEALLRQLTGSDFTGREDEITTTLAYLESQNRQLLFVHGAGGSGKSALLSQALMRWMARQRKGQPRRVWLRVDLDSALVRPEIPATIMAEFARQLLPQFPDLRSMLEDFVRDADAHALYGDSAKMESFPLELSYLHRRFSDGRLPTTVLNGDSVVLWLDTFEEAHFLGRQIAENLLASLLRSDLPRLRILISGRTEPPLPKVPGLRRIRVMALPELPPDDALRLLEKRIQREPEQQPLSPATLQKIQRRLGGNPLTLQLAAPVIAREGEDSLRLIGEIRDQALQQRLYGRVLAHIHDRQVRKLALPGLILRRITPALIREVLAGPCGLGELDEAGAQRLFQGLAREITLVDKEDEDTLRHRADVRALMLDGLPARLKPVARAIDEGAVAFWQARDGDMARAEEIYHRLRLRQPVAQLAQRWSPGAKSLLRPALDELPARSPQRVWLAGVLGAALDDDEISAAGQAEWEAQAALQVQRLLAENPPRAALEVLRQREARLPGSALYALEARAWLLAGEESKAYATALAGAEASQEMHAPVALNLLLFAALLDERARRYDQAQALLMQATALADGNAVEQDRLAASPGLADSEQKETLQASQLSAHAGRLHARLRQLRLSRVRGQAADAGLVETTAAIAEDLQPVLSQITELLREVAAELGGWLPSLVTQASNRLLGEVLRSRPLAEILDLMAGQGLLAEDEARLFESGDIEEVLHVARSRIEERLHEPGGAGTRMALKLHPLFQRQVDALFAHDYSAPPQKKRVRKAAPQKMPRRQREELASLIEQFPVGRLQQIARFQLRMDPATLPHQRPDGMLLVERAIKLQRVDRLVDALKETAPSDEVRISLETLMPPLKA